MSRRFTVACALLLLTPLILAWRSNGKKPLIPAVTETEAFSVGENVFLLVDDTLTNGQNQVVARATQGDILTVQDMTDGSLFVIQTTSGESGWVKAGNVAHIHRDELPRLSRMIAANPDDPGPYACQGLIHSLFGDMKRAITSYDMALRMRQHSMWYHNRGFAKFMNEDYAQALQDFERSLALNPRLSQSYYYRGRISLERDDYAKAAADFNEAIRFDPDDSSSYVYRGLVSSLRDSQKEAIRDFDEALRIDSDHCNALSLRGVAHRKLGHIEQAIADFNKCIRLYPTSVGYRARGEARMAIHLLEDAIDDFNHATDLSAHDEVAVLLRGTARYLLRRKDSLNDFSRLTTHETRSTTGAAAARIYGNLASRVLDDSTAADAFLNIDLTDEPDSWSNQTIRYLRGELPMSIWIAFADTPSKVASARCVLGVQAIAEKKYPLARIHFQWIRDHRFSDLYEYVIAVNELKRMELTQGKN